jgi:hypothetical protein
MTLVAINMGCGSSATYKGVISLIDKTTPMYIPIIDSDGHVQGLGNGPAILRLNSDGLLEIENTIHRDHMTQIITVHIPEALSIQVAEGNIHELNMSAEALGQPVSIRTDVVGEAREYIYKMKEIKKCDSNPLYGFRYPSRDHLPHTIFPYDFQRWDREVTTNYIEIYEPIEIHFIDAEDVKLDYGHFYTHHVIETLVENIVMSECRIKL